jgi:hypothetical protein
MTRGYCNGIATVDATAAAQGGLQAQQTLRVEVIQPKDVENPHSWSSLGDRVARRSTTVPFRISPWGTGTAVPIAEFVGPPLTARNQTRRSEPMK